MRHKISFYTALLIILCFFSSKSYANFDFNENCKQAYTLLFEFKFNAAKQRIQQEKNLRPNNGIIILLENYTDFLYLISSESKAEFERLEKNKETRLTALHNQDKNSPYYLFTQAEINFQWGVLRGRLGSYLPAAKEINRAYKLLEQNQKKYPNFHPNLKGIGFINVVLGALPDGILKSTLSTFGISGNTTKGLQMLAQLADNLPKSNYEHYYEEVVYLYSFLLSDVIVSPDAYLKTMHYTNRFSDSSLLKTYMRAYISLKEKENEGAIQILKNTPKGSNYQEFPVFKYLMGVALLNKLDFTAENYFNSFLAENKGDNYIKDTYLRLSWIKLLKGDIAGFNTFRNLLKKQGYTYHEKDKQAVAEANDQTPHVDLLKARLLFDGGYAQRALSVLANINQSEIKQPIHQVEFHYRVGRVYESVGKDDLAIQEFQKAFDKGKGFKQYYAAKSGVEMGKLYEKKKNWGRAKSIYTSVLSLGDHQFKVSIVTEAKKRLSQLPKT
ncbi:MAG: tetratricopeptide repeat protein [Pedobacter sp.]|nr:MAG: tetratricopeptide repeat protein [Pedobacter sp.]